MVKVGNFFIAGKNHNRQLPAVLAGGLLGLPQQRGGIRILLEIFQGQI